MLDPCRVCPRGCGADRRAGECGFCGGGARAKVASAGAHFGEESVLVGPGGSGTVFFQGCNLACVFCQNYDISAEPGGVEVTAEALAGLMLDLQARGCSNVNFVTPTHFAPAAAEAVGLARQWGLAVPVVYNCGGYESVEVLECLDGLVDIYMPDLKTLDPDFAGRALGARDYPERVRAALLEMQRQVGDLVTGGRGAALRGLLVRHLVMPGQGGDARACLDFLHDEVSPGAFVNVMGQYRPCGEADRVGGLFRRPTGEEISAARSHARKLGLRLAEG